jgi:hypothetical protein
MCVLVCLAGCAPSGVGDASGGDPWTPSPDLPADKGDDPTAVPVDGGSRPTIDDTLGAYPFDVEPAALMSEAAAAPETWVWVDVPGAKCRDGSQASFVTQVSSRSKDVVIVLSGGGGCFTQEGCQGTVSNLNVGRAQATDAWLPMDAFERADGRPFADRSFVFVPYCTGDLHSGRREGVDEIPCPDPTKPCPGPQDFVGHRNMELFLHVLGRYFADAQHVTLTGFSAGAYGALLNYEQTAKAFPAVDVGLISDSGPTFSDGGFLSDCGDAKWRSLYGWDDVMPAACTDCAQPGGLRHLPAYLSEQYPNATFGMVSPTRDLLIYLFLTSARSSPCTAAPFDTFGLRLGVHRQELEQLGNWSTLAVPEKQPDGTENGHVYHHKLDLSADGATVGTWMKQIGDGTALTAGN